MRGMLTRKGNDLHMVICKNVIDQGWLLQFELLLQKQYLRKSVGTIISEGITSTASRNEASVNFLSHLLFFNRSLRTSSLGA